jgi:chromosome segregation ATPase
VRELAQLTSEKAALEELGAQLETDEGSLAACIEVVAAECARLTEQLEDAARHVADIDRQIAAAVEDDVTVTTELESVRRRTRELDGELASLEDELGRYRQELTQARGVFDATFQHTLQMGYRLRHESAEEPRVLRTLGAYAEDET